MQARSCSWTQTKHSSWLAARCCGSGVEVQPIVAMAKRVLIAMARNIGTSKMIIADNGVQNSATFTNLVRKTQGKGHFEADFALITIDVLDDGKRRGHSDGPVSVEPHACARHEIDGVAAAVGIFYAVLFIFLQIDIQQLAKDAELRERLDRFGYAIA